MTEDLPPSDLVLNSLMGAKAATRWATRLRSATPMSLGENLRYEDNGVNFAIRFPQGAPEGYFERDAAVRSAARCLDVVAATRPTQQGVLRRIDDDLLDVACHAWTTARADGRIDEVDAVLVVAASPWSPARVTTLLSMSKESQDITPPAWAENAPRIAIVSSYRTGPAGWRIMPASARLEIADLDAMTILRRSARGVVACSPDHRWTMRGDETWRKASDERRIRR